MPEYIINGVPVNFPFEPYQLQKNYMSKVIECLQNGTNGVLESPTGTGKTLSLLCSSLGWLQSMKSKLPQSPGETLDTLGLQELSDEECNSLSPEKKEAKVKIIYASRTHAQLAQAMQELKNTSYRFVRAIVLGSRDQLCIHGEISRKENNTIKTTLCREAVKKRKCTFYNRLELVKDSSAVSSQPVLDIEDLVKVGRKMKACPYYLSKELIEQADVIFMPYNYLLDPKARKSNGLKLENSVIILDEAHNVEKMCEEIGSAKIRSSDIAVAIEDTSTVIRMLMDTGAAVSAMDVENEPEFTVDDLVLLKEILQNVEKAVDAVGVMFSQGGTTHPGTYIFDLLEKAHVKFGNIKAILKVLNSLITYITTTMLHNFVRLGVGLQSVTDFLEVVYAGNGPEYRQSIEKCFRVHIELEDSKQSTKENVKRPDGWIASRQNMKAPTTSNSKVINFWCFNPAFGMKQLLESGARSIILTSGTLAPLKPLISELNMPVAVTLENPHIIGRSQVYVKVVSHGPDRVELNSSFKNRSNPKYLLSLGRTVLSLCPIIPGGLLIFFPSYPLLHKCSEEWQATGIWEQINRTKPIFIEPRDKESFLTAMAEYCAKVREPESRGAIFMAVCRGKVSEGLDFIDANGRAVMITGLPFPPMMDARVMLKQQYLDTNRTPENELITGNEWYSLEASRAVNQAIGRVIRHKNDFGAILLCDSRFKNARQQSQLSAWIHSHLRDGRSSAPNFGTVVGEMSRFFRNMAKLDVPARVREVYTNAVGGDENEDCSVGHACSRTGNTEYEEKIRINDYLFDSDQRYPLTSYNAKTFPSSYPEEASSSGLVTLYKRERRDVHELLSSTKVNSDTKLVARNKRKLVAVTEKMIKVKSSETASMAMFVEKDSDVEIIEPIAEKREPRTASEIPVPEKLIKAEPFEIANVATSGEQDTDVEIIESKAEKRESRAVPEVLVPTKLIKVEPPKTANMVMFLEQDSDVQIIESETEKREPRTMPVPKSLDQYSDVQIIEPTTEQCESQTAREILAPDKLFIAETVSMAMCVDQDSEVEIIEPIADQRKPQTLPGVLIPKKLIKPSETANVPLSVEQISDVETIMPTVEQREQQTAPQNRADFLHAIKSSLDPGNFKEFIRALAVYNRDGKFAVFIERMVFCLKAPHLLYLLRAMRRFVKPEHKLQFDKRMEQIMQRSAEMSSHLE